MRDGAAERCVGGSLHIDMDELAIQRAFSEGVDARLIDFDPRARLELLSDVTAELDEFSHAILPNDCAVANSALLTAFANRRFG